MRKRTYTESFGLLLSKEERHAMEKYLRERKLSATDYLRQTAIDPIMASMETKDGPDAA